MLDGAVQTKCRAIGRASRIIEEGLKSSLNLTEGGSLAADLRELYGYVGQRLVHANLHNDGAALDECQRLIRPLRDAWASIAPTA
jgi:flagellar protein FliS